MNDQEFFELCHRGDRFASMFYHFRNPRYILESTHHVCWGRKNYKLVYSDVIHFSHSLGIKAGVDEIFCSGCGMLIILHLHLP